MTHDPTYDIKLTAGDLFPDKQAKDAAWGGPIELPEVEPLPILDIEVPKAQPVTSPQPKSPAVHVTTRAVPKVPGIPLNGTEHKPANVLHARVVTGCGGGPEKTILRSPKFADASRYNVTAAYLYPQGDPGMCVIREHAKQLNCPLYEIAEAHALDLHAVDAMAELCRDLKVDIWHSHDYKTNVLGRLIKRKYPMKLVTTAHGFTRETWRTKLYYHIDNLAMLSYDQVIAVSPPLVEHCANHGVNPDRLTYIPNAIDTGEYRRTQTPALAKAEMGLPADSFAIGVIGRLSVEKGVDRAIRMMADLVRTNPKAELHLIGDGPQRQELEQLAAQLGVANSIRWWGWQTDARPIYEMLDMLLLPSRTEGLPNVVLEAMAMRVPVAATDVGGVNDLLDHGACGIILNDNEHDWTNAIAPLLTSPAACDNFAEQAHQRVCESFSFSRRMEKIMGVYDKVMGRVAVNAVNQQTPMTKSLAA